MNFDELTYKLSEVAIHNPDKYFHDYLDYEKDILSGIKEKDGIKSTIFLSYENDPNLVLRFSLIFSDFINLIPIKASSVQLNMPTRFRDLDDERNRINLHIPTGILAKIREFTPDPIFRPVYYNMGDDQVRDLNMALKPFIEKGAVLYRPSRAIFEFKVEKPKVGNIRLFHVNPDSPLAEWDLIDEPKSQHTIPLIGDFNSDLASTLFNLSIPFFDKINLIDLNKILIDEYDLIREFRVELKKIANQGLQDKKTFIEIKEDVLKPRLDRINRKFKAIIKMKTFKNSGVILSSGLLSLVSLITNGPLATISKAIGVAGSGGVFTNQADYINQLDNLKDDPLYLLWKLNLKSH